ncbi:MAG TPA: electron transport complex subunit RsxB [Burkholderiales bacterium]|nr:electron transport complex subunit RsxB [Burkholderiales bacterium]
MKLHLVEKIDAILPQTQCTQCGYAGCKPYATAIASGEADINQCPPGGEEGIRELAALLGVKPKPLNETHGITKPKSVAIIDESTCIGCTLCIQACPVDAIVGAAKQMHTVIASECTGCELCIAPCPVDCIDMLVVEKTFDAPPVNSAVWNRMHKKEAADKARRRYEFRKWRIERDKAEKAEKLAARQAAAKAGTNAAEIDAKKAAIAAAIERTKAKKAEIAAKNSGNSVPKTKPDDAS